MSLSLAKELERLSMPPLVARLFGHTDLASPAGAGVASTTATLLTSTLNLLKPAGSATGFRFPAVTPMAKKWLFFNDQSTTAVVYPPALGKINNGTVTTGGVNLAQNKTAIAWLYDDVNLLWAWIALG